MTADACNVEGLAGPTETTVMGNIAVAYHALGELEDFKAIRKAVSASTDLKRYTPENAEAWENAYADYLKAINK